jgi:hypothetical protein
MAPAGQNRKMDTGKVFMGSLLWWSCSTVVHVFWLVCVFLLFSIIQHMSDAYNGCENGHDDPASSAKKTVFGIQHGIE